MINAQKNSYKDYEELLIKNDKLSEENRKLKYNERLLQNKIKTLENKEEESKIKL